MISILFQFMDSLWLKPPCIYMHRVSNTMSSLATGAFEIPDEDPRHFVPSC